MINFKQHRDNVRVRIVAEILDDLRFIEIDFVTRRDDLGKADTLFFRARERGHAIRAALREQRHRTRGRQPDTDRGVQPGMSVDDAEAIWTDQPDATVSRRRNNLVLYRSAGIAHFSKAAGQDHGGGRVSARAILYCRQYPVGRHGDERQVHRLRNFANGRICLPTENLLLTGMDWKQLSVVAVEVSHQQIAELSTLARRTDEGDPPRVEHRLSPVVRRCEIHGREAHSGARRCWLHWARTRSTIVPQ